MPCNHAVRGLPHHVNDIRYGVVQPWVVAGRMRNVGGHGWHVQQRNILLLFFRVLRLQRVSPEDKTNNNNGY